MRLIKLVLFIILFSTTLVCSAQDLNSLLLNKELLGVTTYINDEPSSQLKYSYEDDKLFIHEFSYLTEQSFLIEAVDFSSNKQVTKSYYPTGECYLEVLSLFENGLLYEKTINNLLSGEKSKFFYLYNDDGYLEEKKGDYGVSNYFYDDNNKIFEIINILSNGKEIIQTVIYENGKEITSPYIDYYMPIDQLIVERKGDDSNYIIIKSYVINDMTNEVHTFKFENDKAIEVTIDQKTAFEIQKYIFKYKDDIE